ncbi:MAG: DDE-type integrase/transposase/recombinase [Phycisphaerae bacterium]|nr:DDE-type integrase/transposase/recombinase [Phycisphaerae bacterium]
MNFLPMSKRLQIVSALVEGCSLRSITRMVGCSINTVTKLLEDLGPICEEYHDQHVRNVRAERVQADEIWAFCYAKDKNLPESMRGQPGVGSVWTWTAIDADSKLMVSWYVGGRDAGCAIRFMRDLAGRLGNRVQLTTDGHAVYERAVESSFGWNVDYAMLVKQYGEPREKESRYSPCECIGAVKTPVIGRPIKEDICTSHVERQNLTMRMGMRRFTRLTNGFSKKLANHRAAVALHFMHYNFCRIHKTIRVTPAMEAGLADHVWELAELVGLMEAKERAAVGTEANKRGPYQKRAKISD